MDLTMISIHKGNQVISVQSNQGNHVGNFSFTKIFKNNRRSKGTKGYN